MQKQETCAPAQEGALTQDAKSAALRQEVEDMAALVESAAAKPHAGCCGGHAGHACCGKHKHQHG